MFEGMKYCILIVTWVLLREINKYELETMLWKTVKLPKLFMSSCLGIYALFLNML